MDEHEFEQILGDSEGQGSLACCMQSMGLRRVGHDLATEQQYHVESTQNARGLPWWLSGKELASRWRRYRFDLCLGKISWRMIWQPTLLGNLLERRACWAPRGRKRVGCDLMTKQQQVC